MPERIYVIFVLVISVIATIGGLVHGNYAAAVSFLLLTLAYAAWFVALEIKRFLEEQENDNE